MSRAWTESQSPQHHFILPCCLQIKVQGLQLTFKAFPNSISICLSDLLSDGSSLCVLGKLNHIAAISTEAFVDNIHCVGDIFPVLASSTFSLKKPIQIPLFFFFSDTTFLKRLPQPLLQSFISYGYGPLCFAWSSFMNLLDCNHLKVSLYVFF